MRPLLLLFAILFSFEVTAQKIFTKNGSITFFSKAPLEDISADNNQVMSVLNTGNGEIQFSLLVKGFHFKKALMEEHFNSEYLQTDKFPKSTFKGMIADISKVNFANDGIYTTTVTGDLTIHGITKKITSAGTINIKAGKISANSAFNIQIADYGIIIPKLVKDNISKSIAITVACNYDQKL